MVTHTPTLWDMAMTTTTLAYAVDERHPVSVWPHRTWPQTQTLVVAYKVNNPHHHLLIELNFELEP
jgi:hypothetical protein